MLAAAIAKPLVTLPYMMVKFTQIGTGWIAMGPVVLTAEVLTQVFNVTAGLTE